MEFAVIEIVQFALSIASEACAAQSFKATRLRAPQTLVPSEESVLIATVSPLASGFAAR